MKKVLLLLLLMLVAGIAAQATVQTGISMQGMKRTVNGKTYFSFAIQTMWGGEQLPAQEGSSYTFSNATIACVTLNGTLNFQEMSSLTDVITGSSFTVTIENNSLWFYGATVQTKSGTDVTGCSASVSSNKHTLTVTIPSGKTFATIIVDYVSNAPFSSSNTVISGLENSYLYLGSPIEPEPVVTYNGTMLTKDTDYTLSYWGSNRVGEAQVTVTGMNEYAGDIRKIYTIRKVALTDFNSLGNKTYEIATTTDLDYLALYITGSDDGSGITFKQTADIAYAHSSAWNDNNGENNFTAIGGYGNSFCGTYDGQNHTISGIRIYKNGTTNYDTSQGLFGFISSGAIVKKVILADARIVGYNNTGGIVGYNSGTIEDCQVESNVDIRSAKSSSALGGIAGISNGNNTTGVAISRCTFKGRVKHNIANSTNVGGIVGTLTNCPVSNCLVLGAKVSGHDYSGAIAGYKTSNSTLTANYYHDSEVDNTDNRSGAYINVGVGIGSGSEDQEGARSVHALTLPDGVTATGESVKIDGATHYAAATTVTLSYSGEVPEGYMVKYSVDGNTITGDTITMPAADATVTMQLIAIDYSITLPSQTPHGTVTSDKATAIVGETVTLTVTPDAGYALGSLTVMNGDTPVATTAGANGTHTFEMPAAPVTVAAEFVLPIDSINFPDANFRDDLLSQTYGSDRVLTDEEIAEITSIFVSTMSIADLTGIEHLTALKQLYCSNNQLTSLDVSHNTALTELQCNKNQLTALDVSHNTALEMLQCGENQLSSLDVSHNTDLKRLYCSDNQLTELDVSQNTALETLYCGSNQLTTLDMSHNAYLTKLQCSENQLSSLYVSHNTDLKQLYCSGNQLTALDVSNNTALTELYCNSNQLQTLDVSHNTALTWLYCNDNQIYGENMAALVASLPTVDVENNRGRNGSFYVIDLDSDTEQNVITTTQVAMARGKNWEVLGRTNGIWREYDGSADGLPIDSVNFPDANFRNYLLSRPYGSDGVLTDGEIAAIIIIDVASKSIADLTGIEHFTALQALYCSINQLTELDVSHNTALIFLACNNNQLTGLDVSHNTALDVLHCFNNPLTELDVSHNTALRLLNCSSNQLTELDVSQNTALTQLDCSDNSLTELDVSQNTALEALDCNNNQLTELEVRQNTALMRLGCNNNPLTGLDVSYNTALTQLDCSNIQLTALDVSQNTALEVLYCSNNQLAQLDVSQNTALGVLDCSGNQINGGNMEVLVASLPTVDVDYWGENGSFIVIDLDSETEQNVITTTQVSTARGKNWTVYGLIDDDWQEYDGSEPTYTISLPESFEHGMVTSDKEAASIGETVTLTVTPDDGYELETLTVTFSNEDEPSGAPLRLRGGSVELTPGENGTYTFQMPAAPVTVNATFKKSIPTDIDNINADKQTNGQRYNLMGQPVGPDYKGVVIQNGKKIIVR